MHSQAERLFALIITALIAFCIAFSAFGIVPTAGAVEQIDSDRITAVADKVDSSSVSYDFFILCGKVTICFLVASITAAYLVKRSQDEDKRRVLEQRQFSLYPDTFNAETMAKRKKSTSQIAGKAVGKALICIGIWIGINCALGFIMWWFGGSGGAVTDESASGAIALLPSIVMQIWTLIYFLTKLLIPLSPIVAVVTVLSCRRENESITRD